MDELERAYWLMVGRLEIFEAVAAAALVDRVAEQVTNPAGPNAADHRDAGQGKPESL